ncbi:MAG: class I tRNA ligase family protein [Candidatus Dormibacterales bacterium]
MSRPVRARLYDTLAGAVGPLPLAVDESGTPFLRLYVCGVTPYDSGHMGHAFTFACFDVLVRHLESQGVRVCYVQNVTDVDDPLFERARRRGEDWKALAEREQDRLVASMDRLGWRRPDVMPRVSEEIPAILSAVERLSELGVAYQADALYFDASTYSGYGHLSRRSRRSMVRKLRDEALLGLVGKGHKADALDFPLWRASEAGEPAWDSPFGPGRPGWHIECSAMAMRYLGEQVEIHGGGRDLVFSHHESERAQSESLTGCAPFAKTWMHTGMVRFQGRKMSKSLGNLVVTEEVLGGSPAAAVRLYLASHHYSRDWSFRWEGLAGARALAARIRRLIGADRGRPGPPPARAAAPLVEQFREALDDDLDTRGAVLVLRAAVRAREKAAAAWMLGVLAGDASLA